VLLSVITDLLNAIDNKDIELIERILDHTKNLEELVLQVFFNDKGVELLCLAVKFKNTYSRDFIYKLSYQYGDRIYF